MSCSLKKYVANLLYRTKELENKLSGLSSLDYIVLDPQETLPTPSEETVGKIYLLLPDPNVETRYEYITIKKNDGTYEWEKLGSTDIDLTGYLNEDNFISSFDNTLQDNTHRMVSDAEKDNWNNNSVHLSELNLTVEQKRTARSNIEAASISLLSNLTEVLDTIVHDYSKDYLTFTALEDTTFTFSTNALQYSLDNGATWTTLAANTASPTVTAGNKILWKANLIPDSADGCGTFSATGNFEVSGNIMSLYYEDNFIGQTDLTGKSTAFGGLFASNTKLVNTKNLILPATTLANYCYAFMFSGCTSLTTTPELPATTLAQFCYANMFNGCTSLTTAPELPATTLTNVCYDSMFRGCTSLTVAPTLPATTLADQCYNSMFYGCTSLTTAPELPATTLVQGCYINMFFNCTSLTTAPQLPATILANQCYYMMFNGCTSLNSITCLATDISVSNCTTDWVYHVAASGTFVKPSSTDWSSKIRSDGIPSGWTVYTESEYELVRHYELPTLATDSDVRDIVTEYNN